MPSKDALIRKAWDAAYRAENREKIRACRAAYRAANRDKIRAYKAANKEKIKVRDAAYRAANRGKIRAYEYAYRAANKEKINVKSATYFAENGEKIRANSRRRTAGLSGGYIKFMILSAKTGLKKEQITPEFIEAKRLHLKLHRAIKELRK